MHCPEHSRSEASHLAQEPMKALLINYRSLIAQNSQPAGCKICLEPRSELSDSSHRAYFIDNAL